jgi:hypothetical protein
MKRQTVVKSVRYGINFKPSTKSTVLFALATLFLVIHVVKSSALPDEEDSSDNNRNFNSNADGELSSFYRFLFPFSVVPLIVFESESCPLPVVNRR